MEKASNVVPWDIEFYFIPGFTRYGLNRNGVLKNLASGKIISWCITHGGGVKNITGGYYCAGIYNDLGKRQGVSRHRLLAMLFIPCPGDIDDYTVNHRDGVPGNDTLDNLEWLTHGQNNQHAYDTGLRPNGTTPIILRYWRTGEEIRFHSLADCAKHVNILQSTLSARLDRANGVAFVDGTQIKYENIGQWIPPEQRTCNVRVNHDCVVTDIANDKHYIFASARSAGRYLGIDAASIRKWIMEDPPVPHSGYLFKKFGDDDVEELNN